MKYLIIFLLVQIQCVLSRATQLQSLTEVQGVVKCKVTISEHLLGLGCSKAVAKDSTPANADRGVFQAFELQKLLSPNYNKTDKFELKWLVSRIDRNKAKNEWQNAEINVALAYDQEKSRMSDIFSLNKDQGRVNTLKAQPWFSFTVLDE